VLDNLETPYDDADTKPTRDTLRGLAAVPSLMLLCSYRGVTAPMAPAFPHQHVVQPLAPGAARDLFLQLAPRIRPDDPHLAPLLRELGGVPLAIELVALRATPHDSLAELWDDWQRRGVELAKDPDLPEGRLTSLVRSIDLSWHSSRLHEAGRRLFRLLGALPAGIAREDRAALLGDDATEAARQLLAIGLAVSAEGRIDLLPPVRGYARARQPPTAEEMEALCLHFLERAKALGDRAGGPDSGAVIEGLKHDTPNLEAAFMAALEEQRRPAAVAACHGYRILLGFTGLGRTAGLHALALNCAAKGELAGEATCWATVADIALQRSDFGAASAAFQRALTLCQQVGDLKTEAACIRGIGDIALARSNHDAARSEYLQALQRYRQVKDVHGEASCIRRFGDIALADHQYDEARDWYQQALPLFREIGNVPGEAVCIVRFGDMALQRSDHNAARASYEQALLLYRQAGAVRGEANCIWRLGDIALQRSDYDAAHAAYEQALPLYRQVGAVLGEANCVRRLGDIVCQNRDTVAARTQFSAALALYTRIGEPISIGRTHFRLAELSDGPERAAHVAAAREAWASIDRPDLVALLDELG
jgi:tetratricopeptide (TPR) repeat protein